MLETLTTLMATLLVPLLAPGAAAPEAASVATLRAQGQPAVTRLVQQHRALLERGRSGLLRDDERARFDAVRERIDAVAGAKDAWASGLFWHADLAAAKAVAKREGKPILSLRMLGNLTDEYSCANSRFFRTLLYPDPAVGAALRDRFVLHWSSERKVPVVTIDMGDGRVMKTTVTGNSAHYVLTADGTVLDAIPGLVAPSEFAAALRRVHTLHKAVDGRTGKTRRGLIAGYHRTERIRLDALMVKAPAIRNVLAPPTPALKLAPVALPVAVGKSAVETPIIADARATKESRLDNATWEGAGATLFGATRLDRSVVEVVAWKSGLSPAKQVTPRLNRRVAAIQRSLDADTARNQLDLHRTIHQWLGAAELDFQTLNRRIYSELFLTPRSDQWLGLAHDTLYSGLPNDGIAAVTR